MTTGRGVGAHAAGVEAGITITDPFVILAGGHRQHMLAVHHDDEARLFPVQKLLDHHPGPGVAKGVAGEHVADRLFRLAQGHGNDHPLPAARPSALMTMGAPFSRR